MVNKADFIKFLMDSGVLTFGDFLTKSGRQSPYFINAGNFTTGAQLAALGRFYAGAITDNIESGRIPEDIGVLFGPAYKGIPLSVAAATALWENHGRNLHYCFNRKEQKDHGEGGSLVGHKLQDGDKVLIIEDVITAGTAVKECVPILKNTAEVQICGLIIAVDRMEKGQGERSAVRELYEDCGIPVFPIVTIKDIIEMMPLWREREGMIPSDAETRMKDYMRQYCVI
ncbi:orotate phosphoribosyltransferase [Bacillota bacterium]